VIELQRFVAEPGRRLDVMTDSTEDVENMVLCHDAVGRPRWLRIFIGERGLVIVAPPGEVAVIEPAQVGQLQACLAELSTEGVHEAVPN